MATPTTSSNSHKHPVKIGSKTYDTGSIGHQHTFEETRYPADTFTDGEVIKLKALLTQVTPAPEPPDPTPEPVPPIVLPFPGFAAADAQVPAGGTVDVPPGVYRERFGLNKPGVTWNLRAGAVVDLTGLGVPLQEGGAKLIGPDIKFIGRGRITGSAGAGYQVEGDRVTVTVEVDHCIQEGYSWHGDDGLMLGGSNHHNDETGQIYSGSEQGAGKARALRLVIDGVHFHDIGLGGAGGSQVPPDGAKGPWWDTWTPGDPSTWPRNGGAEVKGCRIEDVWYSGSMFEISDGFKDHDNVYVRCGRQQAGWIWGAGSLISNSRNAEVYNNVYSECRNGTSVLMQGRSDKPGPTTNVSIHDNTYIGIADIAVGFATDVPALAPAMFAPSSGNKAYANRFSPAIRVLWNGQVLTTLAQINAIPGGGGNSILTAAERDAVLAAIA